MDIPENFYALIAKRHMQATKPMEEEEAKSERTLETAVETLPATEQLYYADAYSKEFDAKVLKTTEDGFVVLDRTCFYPEGGGQPADHGFLIFSGLTAEVVDVRKSGKVIAHKITGSLPTEDAIVKGMLDWERRYALMKAHTATHLVNGAARRVLGEHVWQHGTQKGLEISRLDISHYRRLSPEEIHKIETLANQAVMANMHVETTWLLRNEAESRYGFRLYQGGAVPGKDIRVVKTGNWDVEACAGTHLKSTGEVGFIKIVYTERVQDGVERIGYAVGPEALKAIQHQELILWKVQETLNAPVEKLDKTAEKLVKELKEANSRSRKLEKKLAVFEASEDMPTSVSVKQKEAVEKTVTELFGGLRLVSLDFHNETDVNRFIQTANETIRQYGGVTIALAYGANTDTARMTISSGSIATEMGFDASKIIKDSAPIFGGGGGGRLNFAQGGGTKPEKLQEAVKAAEGAIRKQLQH